MKPYYQDETITLLHGDAFEQAEMLPTGAVDCIVTSPPYYGLRDYGSEGQYGLEESPAAYVETMRTLFAELHRALAGDGTLWLNIGDSYSSAGGKQGSGVSARVTNTQKQHDSRTRPHSDGIPAKNLMGIPWRVALALQDDGWILRNAIVWHKPNAMPESVTDRLSCRYEQFFLFSKSQRYYFNLDPIREDLSFPDKTGHAFGGNNPEVGRRRGGKYQPSDKARPATGERHTGGHAKGKNPGDMWSINTQPFAGAHFAVMPQELARRAIIAGCKPGGTVLDPFSGSGTTGLVAQQNGRKYIGIDLSEDYLRLSLDTRLQNAALDFGGVA